MPANILKDLDEFRATDATPSAVKTPERTKLPVAEKHTLPSLFEWRRQGMDELRRRAISVADHTRFDIAASAFRQVQPMGAEFKCREAVKSLDFAALKKDITNMMVSAA